MSYTINLTNGTSLPSIPDGAINQTYTDLTLIGKSATGYGLYLNDNFVHLLENFANTTQPNNPIPGQLWYDTSLNVLKVYNGTSRTFVATGSTIVSNSPLSSLTTGSLWIDSTNGQLYFNDGTSNILAGPVYSKLQGTSGFVSDTVVDTNGITHTILLLYVGQSLIGIYSKDIAFTPATPISGFSGEVYPGFNTGSLSSLSWNITAANANHLVSPEGTALTTDSFVSTFQSSATTGTLSIQNSTPLILGSTSSTEIDVTSALFNIKSNSINQNIELSALNSSGSLPALFINASSEYVGIYTNTPQATLDVNGSVRIEGNLTVIGTTTSTNTSTINLADLTITLAETTNPTDTTANGAGIIVQGATNHTLLWQNGTGWVSSESISIASGKTYEINGTTVISSTSLGSNIVNIPATLTGLTVSGTVALNSLTLTGNQISYVNGSNANGDIVLSPKGTGGVSVSSAIIHNVGTPVNTTDGANKAYVDTAIQLRPLALTLTTTGLSNGQIANTYISKVYPNTEHQNNSICRAVCYDTGAITGITAGPSVSPSNPFVVGVTYSILTVGTTDFTAIGAASNTVGVVFQATGVGSGTGTANPVIREFELVSGTWTFQANQ